MGNIPSSREILNEADQINPKSDINQIHSKTFDLMKKHRSAYYERKVNKFLSNISLPKKIKNMIKKNLLKPIKIGDIKYSNFMEEASRRISQTFQVISGNLAELCFERELNKIGLKLDVHYNKRRERTDFIIFYPNIKTSKKRHRIEVKNVKLRERGTRGLAFDGDSMAGFFNDPAEFTKSNVKIIDEHCIKTKGYCYVPPNTLKLIKYKGKRFKSNTKFAADFKKFVKTGFI